MIRIIFTRAIDWVSRHHPYFSAEKLRDPASRRRVPALRSFKFSLLTPPTEPCLPAGRPARHCLRRQSMAGGYRGIFIYKRTNSSYQNS